MPRRPNPNGLPKAAAAPPLRTYSRRSLKRRHTSPPAQQVERPLTRTGSLEVAEQKTAEQRSKAKAQHLSPPISNKGRKRVRFLTSANKTPNDLAWEALASSAPVLTRQDDDFPDEERPDEAHVVKCSPGQKGSEYQQVAVKNALNGPTEGREGNLGGHAASAAHSPGNVSLEESDALEDGSSESGQDEEADTTALTSSSEGEGITIPSTSRVQKPKNRGRFLVFDRSPPKGFKVLHRPRVNPETDEAVTKRKKTLTDGFTEDEARPISLGKRRRLQHLDITVGRLDLTQTGIASQQKQKDISPEVKMRPQTRTNAGLWRARQYFGASQFEIEAQDSVDSPKVETTPVKRHQTELDSSGPVIIPWSNSPKPGKTIKMESPNGIHDELVRDSSPSMHLRPKRSMNGENGKIDLLALRPGPPSWPMSAFVIPDTPLLGGGIGP